MQKEKAANSRESQQLTTRDRTRQKFLLEVERLAPQVLKTLESDVLPFYISHDQTFAAVFGLHSERSQFKTALFCWAQSHNLCDQWLLAEAVATLQKWHRNGVNGCWNCVQPKRFYKSDEFLTLGIEPFDPQIETLKSYRTRAEAKLQELLKLATKRAEKQRRFKASQPNAVYHLEWLIKHQIEGVTLSRIAENNKNAALNTVSDAITRLAKLIGLTLRTAPNRKN